MTDAFEEWLNSELARSDHHSNHTMMLLEETLAQYRQMKLEGRI